MLSSRKQEKIFSAYFGTQVLIFTSRVCKNGSIYLSLTTLRGQYCNMYSLCLKKQAICFKYKRNFTVNLRSAK